MNFEFDANKSESNKQKHGIDFIEGQELWYDPLLLLIKVKTTDEPRYLTIGKILDKHWSAIITYREYKIRIISMRRSRQEEVELYES